MAHAERRARKWLARWTTANGTRKSAGGFPTKTKALRYTSDAQHAERLAAASLAAATRAARAVDGSTGAETGT